MEGEIQHLLEEKLATALAVEPPVLTRREIRLPKIPGKALAVVGMRRSGKTSFLWQCLSDLLTAGAKRETLLLLNFEDDRLAGIDAEALSFMLEAYYRLHPELRDRETVTLFLDEIQLVKGWETFARRILDTEKVRLFLSGSSASMLSREVATSMRGRALEVTVFPFSFREALAHRGELPGKPWALLPKQRRSALARAFHDYLTEGGFPEAQGVPARDRRLLLQSYVDVAVLRDVIERHGVSNPVALRWLQRHLLGAPAAPFSIQKFYDTLKSQGIPVAKDTLHAFLSHLEDAFLIRTTSIFSASERQRMVNPRMAYPIDSGLIPVYERTRRANLGHALETAVLVELLRRGCEVHYLRTPDGYEVDFHAVDPEGHSQLIQVCADASDEATWQREVRALVNAQTHHSQAQAILLLLHPPPTAPREPSSIQLQYALPWFLETPES
ncbi:MAG: ATP-binding protein [Opitutales bacterium]|nr:ATP-binding protein [Opitutales bacterium]